MPVPFGELKFGYASAEVEGANEPDLLLAGFFNQKGVINELRNSHKVLFLGYIEICKKIPYGQENMLT